MKLIMENWRKFLKEASLSPEEEKAIEASSKTAINDLGGAADNQQLYDKLKTTTNVDISDITPEELEDMLLAIKNPDGSDQYRDLQAGDLVNTDGLGLAEELDVFKEDLNEAIEIFLEAQDELLDEKKKRKGKKKKKKKGKKDACYHKVRARYSVWPSAYASGALVKCRKVGASNWGNKSKKKKKK